MLVGSSISYEKYCKWTDEHPKLRSMWQANGDVIIYEYPIKPKHEAPLWILRAVFAAIPGTEGVGTPSMRTNQWCRQFDEGFCSENFYANPGNGKT